MRHKINQPKPLFHLFMIRPIKKIDLNNCYDMANSWKLPVVQMPTYPDESKVNSVE